MRPLRLAAAVVAATVLIAAPAQSQERYGSKPPVVLSPDLAAPWVIQLKPGRKITGSSVRSNARKTLFSSRAKPRQRVERYQQPQRQVALRTRTTPVPKQKTINPAYLPQAVKYSGPEKPGTIIIDTNTRFLYYVMSDGLAQRYGVGVGKTGFSWTGTEKITRKAEWPSWRPPAEMIKREAAKGRVLPVHMEGGINNPLGARALYLGSTLYRIHGTNAPWTIGGAVSSGCIRMRNEDVVDLYQRVNIGAKVIVR